MRTHVQVQHSYATPPPKSSFGPAFHMASPSAAADLTVTASPGSVPKTPETEQSDNSPAQVTVQLGPALETAVKPEVAAADTPPRTSRRRKLAIAFLVFLTVLLAAAGWLVYNFLGQ